METNKPKPWKMALLTWLCIYPLINLIFLTVMPMIGTWTPCCARCWSVSFWFR